MLLSKYEEQEAQDARSNEEPELLQPQQPMMPQPFVSSIKPPAIGLQQKKQQQHQIKVRHIEQLLQQNQHQQMRTKTAAEHLRFGGAMSIDLEASSSTAREDHGVEDEDNAHHHHLNHVDVGADSAAEMWLSGDEMDGGLWRREDFAAPSAMAMAPPPPKVEDEGFDGTEAMSVGSS